jgi:hypothetical protein
MEDCICGLFRLKRFILPRINIGILEKPHVLKTIRLYNEFLSF